MTISHNLLAMNAQRQYKVNTDSKRKSTEKLSSGYRINRAADDAAGLTISEKMRSQIRGLTQGVKNCHDGVSMCQIGDGALEEVQDMLHRLTELSVKSSNGTNTQADRDAIQKEVNQILKEIDKIDESTEFNTLPIFGKGSSESSFPESILPVSPQNVINNENLYIPGNFSSVSVTSANINALLTRNADGSYELEDGKNYTFSSDVINTSFHVGQGKSVAVSNTNVNGCNIVCDNSELYIKDISIFHENTLNGNSPISCKGNVTLNFIGTNILASQNAADKAGIEVTEGNTITINGNGSLTCSGGYTGAGIGGVNDIINEPNNQNMRNAGTIIINSGEIYAGSLVYNKYYDDPLEGGAYGDGAGIGGGHGGYGGNVIINGGKVTAFGDSGAAIGSGCRSDYTLLDTSKTAITINGGDVYAYVNKVHTFNGAAIGGGYSNNGANITINGGNVSAFGGIYGAGIGSGNDVNDDYYTNDIHSGAITINGGSVYAEGANSAAAIGLGNSANGFYTNYWYDGFDALTIDGHTEDMLALGREVESGGRYIFGYREGDGVVSQEFAIASASLTGSSGEGDGHGYWIQAGANKDNGFYITFDNVSTTALGIKNLDVSTQDNARKALVRINGALANVSANRSHIGAQQNRLESTIRNEDNIVENTTAAESLIRDADMAEEMVNLTRQNILAQVGESMISQANQTNQGVLTILNS